MRECVSELSVKDSKTEQCACVGWRQLLVCVGGDEKKTFFFVVVGRSRSFECWDSVSGRIIQYGDLISCELVAR